MAETATAPVDTNAAAPAAAPAPDATTIPQSATAAAPPAAAAKAAAEVRKLKLKFEGKEEELSEEEVIKLAQLGKMGHKKSQEKADLEKQVNEFIAQLQKDPFAVLSDPRLGVDVKKQIVSFLEKQVAEEKKSPEQKANEKAAKELEQLRQEKAKLEQERTQERLAREQEKAAYEIDTSIKDAIKNAGLPESPYVIKRYADFMLAALDNGIDISTKDISPLVKNEIENDIKEMFKAAPDELVEQFLGKDRIKGMKSKRLTETQKQLVKAAPLKDTGASSVPDKKEPPKKMTMKEFFKLRG
jgi:hypothetical protein